ncbi:hypothetical protein V8C37DRAFT_65723 [Trichoderma ceciliae]
MLKPYEITLGEEGIKGRLVVRWVTTGEHRLLYVFFKKKKTIYLYRCYRIDITECIGLKTVYYM